jgi:hypothetical protein
MQRVVSKSIFASIVSLAFVAGIASAKLPGSARSSEKAATVEISLSSQVPSGPTLQPGTYKVALLGDSATPQVGFYQNGKLVGQAPAQLVDQGRKSNDTEVHTDGAGADRVLKEIDLVGWTKSIQFGQTAGVSGSSQSGQ